jgi:flagellar protein FliL
VAKAKESKVEGVGGAKPSIMSLIIPLLLLTLIAGGGGYVVATMLASGPPAAPAAGGAEQAHVPAAEPAHGASGEEVAENSGIIRQLSPIITNLASPKDTWMRIEVSIVINPEAKAEQDLIAVKSSDQILAFLRTMDLSQVEGPSGYLHFREDLNDLVRENSDNKVAQVLISSMVVE